MSDAVTVDDNDSRIKYSGAWFKAGSSNELDSTTHGTRAAGAKATFTFTGTSVAVYGTISDGGVDPHSPVSTYSIDGSSVATFTGTQESSARYKQQYFQSSKLNDGSHTLVITSTVDQAFFWIDYIQFTPSTGPALAKTDPTTTLVTSSNPSSDPPVQDSPSTTPITTVMPLTTQGGNNINNNSNNSNNNINTTTIKQITNTTSVNTVTRIADGGSNSPPSSSSQPAVPSSTDPSGLTVSSGSKKAPTGAIVGAVLGGLVIVFLVIFLILCCRRKLTTRRRMQDPVSPNTWTSFFNRSAPITPFTMNEPQGGGTPGEKTGVQSATSLQSRSPGRSVNIIRPPLQNINIQAPDLDLVHQEINISDSPPMYQIGSPITMNRIGRREHSL